MCEYVAMLHAFGLFVTKVQFQNVEINLYKLNGKSIEVWFDTKTERISEVYFITGAEINPYLKFLDPVNLN